jgi:hypothetical protein
LAVIIVPSIIQGEPMESAPEVDAPKTQPGPEPKEIAPKQPSPRPPLDKYAEATRQKKIAKRLRHRVTLRRSHTRG